MLDPVFPAAPTRCPGAPTRRSIRFQQHGIIRKESYWLGYHVHVMLSHFPPTTEYTRAITLDGLLYKARCRSCWLGSRVNTMLSHFPAYDGVYACIITVWSLTRLAVDLVD